MEHQSKIKDILDLAKLWNELYLLGPDFEQFSEEDPTDNQKEYISELIAEEMSYEEFEEILYDQLSETEEISSLIKNKTSKPSLEEICVERNSLKTKSKLKEAILKVLNQETEIVHIYNGGGPEPDQVGFKNSEGWELGSFNDNIAEQILKELKL